MGSATNKEPANSSYVGNDTNKGPASSNYVGKDTNKEPASSSNSEPKVTGAALCGAVR